MSDLEDGLKLDRGELAKAALATPAVVGAFDSGDDRWRRGGPSGGRLGHDRGQLARPLYRGRARYMQGHPLSIPVMARGYQGGDSLL